MDKPLIFVSTVTREWQGARQRIATILQRKGYEPVWQDIFGTEHGDLRAMLRRKIDDCQGLIQIVGDAYGVEPEQPDVQFSRCSYTQYEFLYARSRGTKTWLLIADVGCQRDTPLEELDLPRRPNGDLDTAHPDVVGYQSERRGLQREYRQRPEFATHLRFTAESDLALDLAVERMGDELAELRKEHATWRRRMLRLVIAAPLLVAVVLGMQWWIKAGQDELKDAVLVATKVTPAGIRKQVLLGSERKRDRDLAEAESASPMERERLRDVALAAHESRIERLDELAQSFTELEGRADSTATFKEMVRILEHEGVDMALDYVAEQRVGILERIRKRAAAQQEQTRTELQALLAAADLKAMSGEVVGARASYKELLAVDSEWPAALERYAGFLHDVSLLALRHGTLSEAIADADLAHATASRLYEVHPESFAVLHLFAATSAQLGAVLHARGHDDDPHEVLQHLQLSLELSERLLAANPESAQAARDVSVSLNKLADLLASRGLAGDAEMALEHYQRSLELSGRLLAANPESAQAARDVSVSLIKLADFYASRGLAGDSEVALEHYQRNHELSDHLLAANPESAEAVRDVSISLERLGDFLACRGLAGDAEKALEHYQRSLDNRERLLAANPQSAQAARDVSVSLYKLADFLALRGLAGDAEKALEFYQLSLDIHERLLAANPESGQAARDVALSLNRLAAFLANRGLAGDAEKALMHCRRSFEVNEQLLAANPESAQAARDVSISLNQLADYLASPGLARDAEKALEHYRRSLEVRERLLAANPDSAQASRDVVSSLVRLGEFLVLRGLAGETEKALEHYQRSLEVCDRLLAANPESAQAARDVSVSLNRLADFLASRGLVGDAEKALEHCRRSHEINERVLTANPESAQAANDVSASLIQLGDFLARRGLTGDTTEACEHFQRSLDIRERVLAANTESALAAHDVSVGSIKLGDFLASRGLAGDANKALEHYQRSLDLIERVLAANPDSAQAARDVSATLQRLGDFHALRGLAGDAEKALQHYERCRQILERLLAANKDSAQAARDVSVSLEGLADLLASRGLAGDAEKALEHYQRSLELSERLLAANPESAEAALDVALTLERLAAHHRRVEADPSLVLALQQRALVLVHRLHLQDPTSWDHARTAARCAYLAHRYAFAAGQPEVAEKSLATCHDVLDHAEKSGMNLDPPMQKVLAELRGHFGH